VLGWEPVTDLRAGLHRQAAWHLGRRLGVEPAALDESREGAA
jgi:hypothetical protein